jgi:exodeoxyribonuclease V gamma subunit
LAGRDLYDSGPAAGTVWYDEKAAGFLPLAGIEGSEALVLGSFISFVRALCRLRERLSAPLPVNEWCSELEGLLDDFIKSSADDDPGRQYLHQAFAQLDKHLTAAAGNPDSDPDNEFSGSVSCETILAALERELKAVSGDAGFFRGGITFSSILPLRAVPARMICLIGLNDGDFPRSQRPAAYDLITARPRAGDRNVRDEDRYLFLETLLAARKTLVLSYLGRDPKDNHLRPPAVVVSELIDYVEEHFTPAPESDCDSMRDFLTCDHPPQPFSPSYFSVDEGCGDPSDPAAARLFSYDALQAEIATEISRPARAVPDFFGASLMEVACERLSLDTLSKFFNNPAKFFLRERLKVSPEINDLDRFADSEPFKLDGLDTYKFNDELVACFMDDSGSETDIQRQLKELEKRFSASGRLPPLAPGRIIFADKVKGAQAMAEQLKHYCVSRLPLLRKELVVRLSGLQEVTLTITCANLFRGRDGGLRQVLFRPASEVKRKDMVKTALMNLGLEIIAPAAESQTGTELLPHPFETRFHTLKGKDLVLPVRSAAAAGVELERLLETYFAGLKQPLPFLPELSLLWYDTWQKGRGKNGEEAAQIKARDKVREALMNNYNYAAQDETFHFVFADRFTDEAFWLDFETRARQLGPIFMPGAGE